jgi:MFS family permease
MTYFIVLRFIYGIGIGIVIPLSATYMSEIAPSTERSSILTKSRVYWASGCLATFVIAWYLLYSHQWRLLLFLICIPGVYALYEHLANGKESLRYLWVHKKLDETTELLNYMAVLNERKPIKKDEIEYLMNRN